jgi:hypothetical protein
MFIKSMQAGHYWQIPPEAKRELNEALAQKRFNDRSRQPWAWRPFGSRFEVVLADVAGGLSCVHDLKKRGNTRPRPLLAACPVQVVHAQHKNPHPDGSVVRRIRG